VQSQALQIQCKYAIIVFFQCKYIKLRYSLSKFLLKPSGKGVYFVLVMGAGGAEEYH